MCTTVILRRPAHPWPVILGANRDEMLDRPAAPPGAHWPDRPEVIAGLDELAGGSWLGLNAHGVVAAVMNRHGSLGPQAGKRSRGELVLEALDHADAADSARALATLNAAAYRPFNLLIADNRDAFWLAGHGEAGRIVHVTRIPEGVSMLTAHDLNDPASPRVRHHLPRLRAAPPPDPATGDWSAWAALMASRDGPADAGPEGAMNILTDRGFGTVSSAFVALPAIGTQDATPVFLFADGRPGEVPYRPVR